MFHRKCDGIPNNLTLVRTSADKIIGGFTSRGWRSHHETNHRNYANDNKSFLLSITNGSKYKCVAPDCAIYLSQDHGPMFGRKSGGDFQISDNADLRSSFFNIGNAYSDGRKPSTDLWNEFSGAVDMYQTTIKEWEVFEVIFK